MNVVVVFVVVVFTVTDGGVVEWKSLVVVEVVPTWGVVWVMLTVAVASDNVDVDAGRPPLPLGLRWWLCQQCL